MGDRKRKYGLVVDKGVGVFNGDIGIVTAIHTYDETVEVEFDEKRKVKYPFKMLDELELAYAITIHKSQGSEYPAVVNPAACGTETALLSKFAVYSGYKSEKNVLHW